MAQVRARADGRTFRLGSSTKGCREGALAQGEAWRAGQPQAIRIEEGDERSEVVLIGRLDRRDVGSLNFARVRRSPAPGVKHDVPRPAGRRSAIKRDQRPLPFGNG